MKLKRLTKIKNYRVFHDFAWSTTLLPFSRFNLIYGWNGSGKTTLTSIFRALQQRTPITNADIEVDVDGNPIQCANFGGSGMPDVRVFDRLFVAANVFEAGGQFSPIYVLGEDSADKQRAVERLREELRSIGEDIIKKQTDKSIADSNLDRYCITQGKVIRELLNTSGRGTYNSYDKGHFKRRAESLTAETAKAAILDEAGKAAAKALINTKPKETLQTLSIAVPDAKELTSQAEALLAKSVVSGILKELATDTDVAIWVQRGLALHTGEKESKSCRFCGQKLPSDRIGALEKHFNDDFKRLQRDVQALIDSVNGAADRLSNQRFHDSSKVYENLEPAYKTAQQKLADVISTNTKYLEGVAEALLMKRENPLIQVKLQDHVQLSDISSFANLAPSVMALNDVIERHNQQSNNFELDAEAARATLELSIVGEAWTEFDRLRRDVASVIAIISALKLEEDRLKREIDTLEKDIIEHRRPVAELNAELEAYLGRKELQLDFKDTGYAITRNGHPASDLSEGEKTAIGFLYFLKTLKDKSFKLSEGIVVIDDPVSSLDANSLFCAFGYMRDRTQDAAQLFILTHNFNFFRQVRSWFRHLPHQNKKNTDLHPARFYLVASFYKGMQRNAALYPLDSLLHEYESEYHYLFKHVVTESEKNPADQGLEQYYGMPNVARRLLEAFLAFKYPALCGDLPEQLNQVKYDSAKKATILRFLHTFSHKDNIAEGDHDISILSETKQVLVNVLDLMNEVDKEHFAAMKNLIAPPAAAAPTATAP